jgi:hypothetical protein
VSADEQQALCPAGTDPTGSISERVMAKEKEKASMDGKSKIRAVLMSLTEPERKFLSAVIAAERDELSVQKPGEIHEELWQALTVIIR